VANVKRTAWLDDGAVGGKRRLQKLPELGSVHPIPLDLETILRVALIVHVIRAVAKHKIDFLASTQPFGGVDRRRVSAQDPVSLGSTQKPQVAQLRYRCLGNSGTIIRVRQAVGPLRHCAGELLFIETSQLKSKTQPLQVDQLRAE